MSFKVIAGRAGSGKSAIIYNRINDLVKNNIPAVLLVPEQFTLQAERELIASGNSKGLLTVNVMSISRLAKDIFATVENPINKIIDERGKAAAIITVAGEIKDELKIFQKAVSFTGFASEAATLISDFKKHDIKPNDLILASKSTSGTSADKIYDIGKIYDAFHSFLKKKDYIDSDDKINLLAELLPHAKKYQSTHFFMDGFDTLTAQDLKIAKSLHMLSGELTVTINYAKGESEELFFSGERALNGLQKIAQDLKTNLKLEYATNPHVRKHPSILHLEKNLFKTNPETFSGECSINISEAATAQEEAEHIACSILNLVKDEENLSFSDISILCCSELNTYAPLFERMFSRYEIPCFAHRRKSISEHPAVSYILSALSAKIYTTPKSDITAMLKSGYLNISFKDAMLFEDYILDNAIDSYLFTRPLRRGAKKYDLKKINSIRETLINPLNVLSLKHQSAKEHLKSIYHLIDNAKIKKSLIKQRDELLEAGALQHAALTSQVYNSIISVLEQLNVLFEEKEMTLEQILIAMEESFVATQLGTLPASSNEVLIGELGRTKLAETKHLFVVGANEQNLPPLGAQNSILSDWDVDALSQLGVDFMKSTDAKHMDADYAVYQAFSLPSRALHISYAKSSENSSMLPSQIVKNIEEIYDIEPQPAKIDYKSSKAAALTIAARAFGALGDGRMTPPDWKQAVSSLLSSESAKEELQKMSMFLSSNEKAYDMTPKKDGVIISSVSQIEQYAGCPFSYMIKYALSPADDPDSEITPAGEGAFLHEAMERLGIKLSEIDAKNMTEAQIEEIMENEAQIIAQNFDNQRLSRDAKGGYQASSLIKKAKHGAIVYSNHLKSSKFKPIGQEVEFGEGKDLGPIEVTLESGTKVHIGGKVDRLDQYEDYARIVDYKSSVKKIDYSRIESGRQLQLLIYMNAYLEKNKDLKASGVFYFPLRKNYIDEDKNEKRNDKMQGLFIENDVNIEALDKNITELGASSLINAKIKKNGDFDKNSDNISEKGFEKLMLYAKDKASEMLDKMDSGQAPVIPAKSTTGTQCQYCDYSSICKKDVNMHEEHVEMNKDAAKKLILGDDDG